MTDRSNSPSVLITGASSGFGRLTVERFHAEGWNVLATMRSPDEENELAKLDRVRVERLDVTDRATIDACVERMMATWGRVDAVVNNAGYGAFGLLEEADDQDVRAQMETNFFGVVQVIQAALPALRRGGGGTIVNVTSVGGSIGMPMLSLYSASKFAVEGLSESLNHELAPFGIKVRTVAPGSYDTRFGTNHAFVEGNRKAELDDYRETYRDHLDSMLESPPAPFGFGDPQEVADLIFRVATKPGSKVKRLIGKDARMIHAMRSVLPYPWFFKVLHGSAMPKLGSQGPSPAAAS